MAKTNAWVQNKLAAWPPQANVYVNDSANGETLITDVTVEFDDLNDVWKVVFQQ